MISTGRLVRDSKEHFVDSYPVISKIPRGEMLIRTVNKFSLSLSPSASDSPVNTKFESQIPLSSWTEQQPRTERLVMDACSSHSSEWNIDDKWSSQVRRTGVHPILMCGRTCKMCTDNIFFVQYPLSCCRFRLQSITIHCNRRGVNTHMRILSICERPAGGKHAARPHNQNGSVVFICSDVSLLLARAMWKSPIPQASTAMQQQ